MDQQPNTDNFNAKQIRQNQLGTLSVVIIIAFITSFTSSALNLSVPAISEEFQASATAIGWIVTGYILASAALSVPFGRFADLTGRKRVLISGIAIFSLFTGIAAFAWSLDALIIFRVIQGIGAAMIFCTNQAILISTFPAAKRGKVLGYSIASIYTGLTAGPIIGGLLNHYFGWRYIFIFTFVISVTALIIAAKKLPHSSVEKNDQIMDILGSVLYISMIICIMYGFSAYATTSFAKYLIPIGIILLIVFIYYELKINDPIIATRLFSNNLGYLFSNIAALLNYGATFALGYLLSIYLQLIKGYDSQVSGFILISQPLIMAIFSPYAGKLSDKISSYKIASVGMALCALGLFSFIFVTEEYSLLLIIINLVVLGLGFALFSSPNTNAVMSYVEPKDYGVASSILATIRTIGHSASMAIVTFIVALQLGSVSLVDAETSLLIATMRISFIVFTCLCGIGIFFSLKRK